MSQLSIELAADKLVHAGMVDKEDNNCSFLLGDSDDFIRYPVKKSLLFDSMLIPAPALSNWKFDFPWTLGT